VQTFGIAATDGFRATGKTDGAKWFATEKSTDGGREVEYLMTGNVIMEREVNPNARFRQSRDGSASLSTIKRLIDALPNDLATSKVGSTETVAGTLATSHTHGGNAGEINFWFDERGQTIVKIQLFPTDKSARSMAAEFTEFQKPQSVPTMPNLRRW
jgi:outer membrane lipoprotein-sorting protein